jgi:hypothetical protein
MTLLLATAAINELRRKQWRAGRRTVVLESGGANLCPRSEDLSTWTKVGAGATTPGQADPAGGTTAYKIDDQDAAAATTWTSPNFAAYSGAHTTRGFSFHYKADTGAVCDVRVRDVTALVDRQQIVITPVAGVVTLAGVALTGAGRVVAVIPVTHEPGHYRILFEGDTLTVANNHAFVVRPAGSTIGNLGASIVWGFQAHQSSSPYSQYFPNAGASGSTSFGTDLLRLPWLQSPGATTLYARYYEVGAQSRSLRENSQRVITLGDAGNNPPRLIIFFLTGSDQPRMWYTNAASVTVTSTVAGFPTLAYGDKVELLGLFYPDGSVQIGWSVNGSVPAFAARSAGQALPVAWAGDGTLASQLVTPVAGTGYQGCGELEAMIVTPGLFTFAEMQALR